jgi:hypothetical protein
MGCFAVPTTAAVVHYFMRKKNPQWKASKEHKWLNLLWAGGAIFGIVDHAWNGELFMVSPNLFSDMMLGITITGVIYLAWLYVVHSSKTEITVKTEEPVTVKAEK